MCLWQWSSSEQLLGPLEDFSLSLDSFPPPQSMVACYRPLRFKNHTCPFKEDTMWMLMIAEAK
jgi:hypothetical protein